MPHCCILHVYAHYASILYCYLFTLYKAINIILDMYSSLHGFIKDVQRDTKLFAVFIKP